MFSKEKGEQGIIQSPGLPMASVSGGLAGGCVRAGILSIRP